MFRCTINKLSPTAAAKVSKYAADEHNAEDTNVAVSSRRTDVWADAQMYEQTQTRECGRRGDEKSNQTRAGQAGPDCDTSALYSAAVICIAAVIWIAAVMPLPNQCP